MLENCDHITSNLIATGLSLIGCGLMEWSWGLFEMMLHLSVSHACWDVGASIVIVMTEPDMEGSLIWDLVGVQEQMMRNGLECFVGLSIRKVREPGILVLRL